MPYADELLGAHTVRELAGAFAVPLPTLVAAGRAASTGTLRARHEVLRRALLADLPGRYADVAALVRAAHHSPALFRGWMLLPVTTAVAARAVADGSPAAYDDAMALLGAITGRFTSEFALRPLLIHDLGRGLRIAADWARSPDEDLRRLAVAGTRPYLPWAARVPAILAEPRSTVPLLELVDRDDTEYVRRAVAGHLADLARRDPQLAAEITARRLTNPGDDRRQR